MLSGEEHSPLRCRQLPGQVQRLPRPHPGEGAARELGERDVAPHREVGYPLVAGVDVEFVVDGGFRDARGAPLAAPFVQRYFDNSLSYDSPLAQKIADAARDNKITVVLGLSERDGGSLYISQWLIGPDGETIAKRRKLRPTHVERTVFGEGDGSHIAVHDRADLGRLGALCCWEHLQPLTKYAMYAQNEQVHVGAWPSFSMYEPFAHALGWETNNAVSKVYAVEGSCFVLAPCAVISREMVEEMCDTEDKRNLVHEGGGHAVIYGPDGNPLAEKLPETSEGIVYATIDLAAIGVAKNAADPVGHYSRPDVVRLLFNNKPAKRVEHFSLPHDVLAPD